MERPAIEDGDRVLAPWRGAAEPGESRNQLTTKPAKESVGKMVFSAHPQRSLRLGGEFAQRNTHRRDAEIAELTQSSFFRQAPKQAKDGRISPSAASSAGSFVFRDHSHAPLRCAWGYQSTACCRRLACFLAVTICSLHEAVAFAEARVIIRSGQQRFDN